MKGRGTAEGRMSENSGAEGRCGGGDVGKIVIRVLGYVDCRVA